MSSVFEKERLCLFGGQDVHNNERDRSCLYLGKVVYYVYLLKRAPVCLKARMLTVSEEENSCLCRGQEVDTF